MLEIDNQSNASNIPLNTNFQKQINIINNVVITENHGVLNKQAKPSCRIGKKLEAKLL